MIVDASAFIAILKNEPDQMAFVQAMHEADQVIASTTTLLEASIVAEGPGRRRLDELFEGFLTRFVAFDEEQARIARDAYLAYGKGSGSRAKLNFGDCMSYALAKVRDEPLLFKGDDFGHTDITPAI